MKSGEKKKKQQEITIPTKKTSARRSRAKDSVTSVKVEKKLRLRAVCARARVRVCVGLSVFFVAPFPFCVNSLCERARARKKAPVFAYERASKVDRNNVSFVRFAQSARSAGGRVKEKAR